MYDDSELIMISALEHYSYCPRQCALIHVEQIFEENKYLCISSLVLSPNVFAEYKSFYVGKLMVEYLCPVLRAPVSRPSAGQLPDAHALTRLCLVIRHLAGAWMDRHADERLPHALLAPPVAHGRGTARGIRLDHQGAHGLV